jgi:hypothetical protein
MGDINDNFVVRAAGEHKEVEDFLSRYAAKDKEDDPPVDEFAKAQDSDSLVEEFAMTQDNQDDYKQALKSLIEDEVKQTIDEEIKKAKQELMTEQRKAILQIVEENKAMIRELVGEEKAAIRDKAADLRKSLLLHLSDELGSHNT